MPTYLALLTTVCGYKVAEATHWDFQGRLRPANCWVWLQMLRETQVVDADDQWLLLCILFGAHRGGHTFADVEREAAEYERY